MEGVIAFTVVPVAAKKQGHVAIVMPTPSTWNEFDTAVAKQLDPSSTSKLRAYYYTAASLPARYLPLHNIDDLLGVLGIFKNKTVLCVITFDPLKCEDTSQPPNISKMLYHIDTQLNHVTCHDIILIVFDRLWMETPYAKHPYALVCIKGINNQYTHVTSGKKMRVVRYRRQRYGCDIVLFVNF